MGAWSWIYATRYDTEKPWWAAGPLTPEDYQWFLTEAKLLPTPPPLKDFVAEICRLRFKARRKEAFYRHEGLRLARKAASINCRARIGAGLSAVAMVLPTLIEARWMIPCGVFGAFVASAAMFANYDRAPCAQELLKTAAAYRTVDKMGAILMGGCRFQRNYPSAQRTLETLDALMGCAADTEKRRKYFMRIERDTVVAENAAKRELMGYLPLKKYTPELRRETDAEYAQWLHYEDERIDEEARRIVGPWPPVLHEK